MSFPGDIISTLVALLEANWLAANTSTITPAFGTGWLNVQRGPHQVIVAGDPSEMAVGQSGVYGIDGAGGNCQLFRGMAFVEHFAETGDGLEDPMKLVHQFRRETQRIVMANITSVVGYDYVSYLGGSRIYPKPADHPTGVRYSSRIGYQWRNTVTA